MALRDFFDEVESRRQTVTVFAPARPEWLSDWFDPRHVRVEYEHPPAHEADPFVVVSEGGEFLGSVDLRAVEAMRRPTAPDPDTDAFREAAYRTFLSLLPDAVFSSFDRRQLLAASREVEDRALRVGRGSLFAGFQSRRAFRRQSTVYERLARDTDLDVRVYGAADWDPSPAEGVRYYGGTPDGEGASGGGDAAAEFGRFWFVAFDGGGRAFQSCASSRRSAPPARSTASGPTTPTS